jgi:hypothetical protein
MSCRSPMSVLTTCRLDREASTRSNRKASRTGEVTGVSGQYERSQAQRSEHTYGYGEAVTGTPFGFRTYHSPPALLRPCPVT